MITPETEANYEKYTNTKIHTINYLIKLLYLYINREKQHWATCWRPGMILEDGTLDMSYDLSLELIVG